MAEGRLVEWGPEGLVELGDPRRHSPSRAPRGVAEQVAESEAHRAVCRHQGGRPWGQRDHAAGIGVVGTEDEVRPRAAPRGLDRRRVDLLGHDAPGIAQQGHRRVLAGHGGDLAGGVVAQGRALDVGDAPQGVRLDGGGPGRPVEGDELVAGVVGGGGALGGREPARGGQAVARARGRVPVVVGPAVGRHRDGARRGGPGQPAVLVVGVVELDPAVRTGDRPTEHPTGRRVGVGLGGGDPTDEGVLQELDVVVGVVDQVGRRAVGVGDPAQPTVGEVAVAGEHDGVEVHRG